jgi:hypothetical protein
LTPLATPLDGKDSTMSNPAFAAPANFTCSAEDWRRAYTTLEHILQDQDWTKDELCLRHNTLIEAFRAHGIARSLALALLEQHLVRGVFREGKSFFDLRVFVRFDGQQTDDATPNRFLLTTRERWFAYLASGEGRFDPRRRDPAGVAPEVTNAACREGSCPTSERSVVPGSPASPDLTNLWRRSGEVWTLRYAGKTVEMRDRKGLGYIARLIAAKGRLLPAAALVTTDGRRPEGLYVGEVVLDDQAIREYRARYEEIRKELEQARRHQDLGVIEKLQLEMASLQQQLQAASGLGKRKRRLGDQADRVRKSVQMAITRALQAIAKEHPALARHLKRSLTTGRDLSYRPEPDLDWSL